MLGKPRSNAGLLEQAANDRCATIAVASGPPHINPEPAVIERPDREPIGTRGADVRRHLSAIGTIPPALKDRGRPRATAYGELR
jgi:hypothetical protein